MEIGGTEGHVATLLKGLNPDLFDSSVLVLGNVADRWRETLGSQLITLPDTPGFTIEDNLLKKLLWIRTVTREKNVSVIQSFFCVETLLSLIGGVNKKCAVVISKRNLMPNGYPAIHRIAARFFFSRCTGALANSKAVQERSVEYDKIPIDKFSVIYNGIDINRFNLVTREEKRSRRDFFNLDKDAFIVGAVANYKSIKGLKYLILAASKVKRTIPNINIVLVGRGSEKKSLLELTQQQGLVNTVHFFSNIQKVDTILPILDVAVLPSLSEGFSNSLLEYAACSLPIIATDVGGNSEVITNYKNGFLVEPQDEIGIANKILTYFKDSELRKKHGSRSRKIVEENFSIQHMIENYEKYYLDIVSSYGKKQGSW